MKRVPKPQHDQIISWLQSKSQLFDAEGSFGNFSLNRLETLPAKPQRVEQNRTQDHPSLHLNLEHTVNSISQKLSEEFKICCSWVKDIFWDINLAAATFPAMVRKITLTNCKPLCLFSSVYSIRYFTAATSSLELALMFKNDPRYTNNSAYWVTVF